jgi:autotransporter-associated beta strand protein
LGNGAGTLNLDGGNLLGSANRAANPLPNPIIMTADTTMPVATTGSGLREFPFAGGFTTSGGTLTIRNTGTTNGYWTIRFQNDGLNFTRPIVIGQTGDLGGTRVSSYQANDAADHVFSGEISGYGDFYRSAGLAGTGGRTILTAANTYSGGTIVSDGTLLVNNTTGSGTGSGTVSLSASGVLAGTGTIAGAVTATNGGNINAGNGVGVLTLQGGLDLSQGGTNVWELAANTTAGDGTSFDQLALTGGNLVLGGSSRLQLAFVGTATFPDGGNAFWQSPRSWKVISLSGAASNPGLTFFAGVDGVEGNTAGTFSTTADAAGIYLNFNPGVTPPEPYIDPNVVGAGTASAQLSWSSVAGAGYTVQYKTNLNQTGWLTLTNLTAEGTTTTIVDNTSPVPNQRYYRVVSP